MDLTIIGIDANQKEYVFRKPIAFYLQCDRFTPADSFEFTTMDDVGKRKIMRLRVKIDGKQVFWGIVDVQKTVMGTAGRYLSLVCRSMPCLMLDNEVKPCTYAELTSGQLIKKHALPYGAGGSKLPYQTKLQQVIAAKGISHWEFIVFYCQMAYGKTPYLNRNGDITLSPYTDVKHKIANLGKGYLRFTNATVCEDRYNMISDLWVKTGKTEFGASYNYLLYSSLARDLGITRERYYNPSREWETQYKMGARSRMVDQMLDYLEVQVTLPGFVDAHVGDAASFVEGDNRYDHLYVTQMRLLCDESGVQTKLRLWDQNMLVM